jgi:hypothetical protein
MHRLEFPSRRSREREREREQCETILRQAEVRPVIHAIRADGGPRIRGFAAPRGGNWSPVQVSRVLALS